MTLPSNVIFWDKFGIKNYRNVNYLNFFTKKTNIYNIKICFKPEAEFVKI